MVLVVSLTPVGDILGIMLTVWNDLDESEERWQVLLTARVRLNDPALLYPLDGRR